MPSVVTQIAPDRIAGIDVGQAQFRPAPIEMAQLGGGFERSPGVGDFSGPILVVRPIASLRPGPAARWSNQGESNGVSSHTQQIPLGDPNLGAESPRSPGGDHGMLMLRSTNHTNLV